MKLPLRRPRRVADTLVRIYVEALRAGFSPSSVADLPAAEFLARRRERAAS